jgi:hypothetical protein
VISINWATGVIFVPRADMLLVQSSPIEIRELNLNTFRLDLKDLEDSEGGMPFQKTHNHNTSVTISGVQLARVIEILIPYTITFEDGSYAVNLVGANSNVGDRVNLNQVSVRAANSAGLIQTRELEYASFDGGVTLYDVWEATPLSSGASVITISESLNVPFPDNTPVTFFIRSSINASSHTFEWVGTGNSLANALPATGAMPIQANEVRQLNGGSVVFTSTDQRGDFRIGSQLTINGSSGTITGETFDKALFAVLTPYILAIEG